MNAKLKSITAKVIGIDSSKASITLENQNKQYQVQLSDLFLDSFNQIEFILRASETVIHKQDLFISLVNILIDDNNIEFSDSLQSYIVLEPNWLVNVTSLTQFDFCERSLFNNRFSLQSQNEYMLMGNIIHEVFEDILSGISSPQKIFFKTLNQKLKRSIHNKIFDFALLDLDVESLESKIRNHLNALYVYIKNNRGYYLNKEILTEHYMMDNQIGLKGKIDSVIMNSDNMIAVELKTGKSWGGKAKPGHSFQAQAYSLLLENKYKDRKIMPPVVLYSGDHEFYDTNLNSDLRLGMKVDFDYKSKAHVVNLRNRLITADFLFKLEYENKNSKKCNKCFQLSICKNLNHLEPVFNLNNQPIYNNDSPDYTNKEKDFFKIFNQYLTEESSTIKKQIGEFFSKDTDERIAMGKCVEIKDVLSNGNNRLVLKCDNRSELREKERCIVSDINGPIKGACLEAFILKIMDESIELRVNKDIKFIPKWIDSINSESIFERNYPSIVNLLNSPKLQKIKDILINDSIPKNNKLIEFQDTELDIELNQAQQSAIQSALGIEDLLLIQGPPGTGKTLTIAKIVREMYSQGKTILLSCFTHRAIDELIRKIKAYAPDVEFYRIGLSSFNDDVDDMEKKYNTIENIDLEIKKIKNNIDKRPVYIGTAYAWLSGRYDGLIGDKLYDVAIIDEASQMILPNSIGVIRLANSFILVGDHLQQPPVIQSSKAKELSKTLFQTLFENKNLPLSTKVMLDTQHRMNPVIGNFISKMFYENKLNNNEALEFKEIYSNSDSVSMVSKICLSIQKIIITLR